MSSDAFRAAYDKYRVEDQRRYYEARLSEYLAADRESELLLELLLVTASLAGLASIWSPGFGYATAVLSAMAIIVSGWAELIGFHANAALFSSAAGGLTQLRSDHEQAPSSQDTDAVYVEEVESVLLGEVRSWGRRWSQTIEFDDGEVPQQVGQEGS